MPSEHEDLVALLDRWREQGRDRADPVRFAWLDALIRRAGDLDGEARRLLHARASELLAGQPAGRSEAGMHQGQPRAAQTALTPLLDAIAQPRPPSPIPLPSAHYPELPLLETFRTLWTQLRTHTQLQGALQPAETDAGPLNSRTLVLRSLTLMRGISPGYLQHFIHYVDTLSSLESLREPGSAGAEESPRGAAKESRRTRARKRST